MVCGALSSPLPACGERPVCFYPLTYAREGKAEALQSRPPPPGGGRSARVSGPGGGDSASADAASPAYAAPPPPHSGLPSAVRPSPQPKPRIRGFLPLNKVIEIGNSLFRLGGGRGSTAKRWAMPC